MFTAIRFPKRLASLWFHLFRLGAAMGVVLLTLSVLLNPAKAAGSLSIEIIAGYNLVVDSNVLSPSTYAPSVATVIGKFCNNGDEALTGVQGFIGDYNPPTSTPGIYPSRNSVDAAFISQHPDLANSGSYRFTHVGGRTGVKDATRFIGTLQPGECKVQYWHFTYPRRENPDNTGPDPVWGVTHNPNDDLWLDFDIWGTSAQGSNNNATHRMTMRNEISAMANKIEPNPNGLWFNTDGDTVAVGETITSNGVRYELGVVNKGFDNDGDYSYDFNAWLQPIGDPSYDPSCFRLVSSTGVLTVTRSGGLPDMLITFDDDLYFTNLPEDNTGVTGEVHYTFLALDGPCSTALTPYQEAASGADNEKFNGDFGAGIPPTGSFSPDMGIDKTSSPKTVALGGTITYQIPFANTGTASAGLPLYNAPLVISDTVPAGANLGAISLSTSYANSGYTVLYSNDNAQTWSAAPLANTTHIQVWMNDVVPAAGNGTLTVNVTVPLAYSGSPFIENTACGSFGASPSFECASTMTMVSGSNSNGDLVWQDDDGDGLKDVAEPGLVGVGLRLYWDRNGDGALDATDPLMTTTDSVSGGAYSFSNLPNGDFLVEVDNADAQIPAGYSATTRKLFAVTDLGTVTPSPYTQADFGFGPALRLDKRQSTANPVKEGSLVTYVIDLVNTRPGDGTGQGSACVYTVWAAAEDPTHTGSGVSAWSTPANAFGASGPDFAYASSNYSNNANSIAGTNFSLGAQAGSISSVEALFSIYVQGTLSNDTATTFLYFNDSQIATRPFTFDELNAFGPAAANKGLLAWDVSAARGWTFADFSGNLDLQLDTVKASGVDGAVVYLDAMGFRVTTSASCGGTSETIAYLPLSDTYDPARLEFYSADPAPTTAGAGTVSWSDLGPLYAGQTKSVTVVFRALQPASEAQASTINTANVSGALFGDGRAANNATDNVTTLIDPTGSIGDRVWYDTNGDGLQTGEQGIPNVTLRLCDSSNCNGTVFGTATTDLNGNYLFSGLANGTAYYVVLTTTTLPGGSTGWTASGVASPAGPITINNTDGNPANNDNLAQDFGYRRAANAIIFGNVWEDNNGNGLQASGENGFNGVQVQLFGCGANAICGDGDDGAAITSTNSDTNGNYLFTGVATGSLRYVRVNTATLPAGGTWANTADPESDVNSRTDGFTPAAGGYYGAYNFGYYRSGAYTIGDTLYKDWDGDGVQDLAAGTGLEEGLPLVTIWLYEDVDGDGVVDLGTDALILADETDADGLYQFTSLAGSVAGVHYLVIVDTTDANFPADVQQTQDYDEGTACTTCDSKAQVTLTTASVDSADFGYLPIGYATIGDFVWQDADSDGIQDASETGIQEITIRLYEDSNNNGLVDSGDALVTETPTDADGLYQFTSLPAGNYLVDVDTSDAQLPTDGDGNRYVLSTANDPHDVALAASQSYTSADFGFTTGGIIGDLLWQDDDGDGGPDTSEPGIPGVTVRLYADSNGNGVYDGGEPQVGGDALTDASGLYAFTGLPAGSYVVVVDTSDPQLPSSVVTGDPDDLPPCNVAECNAESGVDLRAGQVDRSRDFGFQTPGVIGDTVWFDANDDGLRGATESGIPGVTVGLYDCGVDAVCGNGDDTQLDTTITDSEGYYTFGDRSDGSYNVRVISGLPTGVAQTYDPDATLDGIASTVLAGGNSDFTRDFGYKYVGVNSISGAIFFDAGNDGGLYQSGVDTGWEGLPVYLWRGGSIIAVTSTGPSGGYTFANLPDGDYVVSVNRNSTRLDDYTLKTPIANPYYAPVTISGSPVSQIDFGFYAEMDFGDLPAGYGLSILADEGARHLVGVLYLGGGVDADPDGMTDDNANLDTNDNGVTRSGMAKWIPGDTVTLDVSTSNEGGYLVGWLDWNDDGDFADADEMLVFGPVGLSDTVNLQLPASYTLGQRLYARFRLYDGAPGSPAPTGAVVNGEVEDYLWVFAPTAVTLVKVSAQSAVLSLVSIGIAVLLALISAGWLLSRQRKDLSNQ